jgi:hypothetical protein
MDLNDLKTWQYGAAIGGGVLLLGFVLYFLPARRLKVPGVLTATLGGLATGLALGVIWLAGFGYRPYAPPPAEGPPAGGMGPPPGMGKDGGAGPKLGGGAGKGKGGGNPKGGFGGGPPGPRVQLVSLVNALDTLVDRPVALALTADDKKAIAAQLDGLDATGEIKDEDAKARLDAILKVVEKDRKALEAVGYRWPSPYAMGPPKGGFPKDSPNPFAEGQNKEKLKSLQERLDKK